MTTLSHAAHRPGRARRSFLAQVRLMLILRRQRLDLATLPDERLEDLGLTRADVAAELARPLWDVPQNWRF